jgi:hypothetical protein
MPVSHYTRTTSLYYFISQHVFNKARVYPSIRSSKNWLSLCFQIYNPYIITLKHAVVYAKHTRVLPLNFKLTKMLLNTFSIKQALTKIISTFIGIKYQMFPVRIFLKSKIQALDINTRKLGNCNQKDSLCACLCLFPWQYQ